MTRSLDRFVSLIDKTNDVIGRFVSYLIYFLTFVIVLDVILRYIFNRPTIWGLEVSLFFFGAYFLLGGGYDLLHHRHVNVDIISRALFTKTKAIINLILAPFFFFFFILLFWKGGEMFIDSLVSGERSATMWAPFVAPYKVMVPLAALLILIQGVANYIRDLSALRGIDKRKLEDGRDAE